MCIAVKREYAPDLAMTVPGVLGPVRNKLRQHVDVNAVEPSAEPRCAVVSQHEKHIPGAYEHKFQPLELG